MEEYILAAILTAIVVLFIYRYRLLRKQPGEPEQQRGNPIGRAMTIGSREIQADYLGSILGAAGTLLVLADGIGSGLGSKLAARTAVDTALELYKDYRTFDKPEYYFRRVFNTANHRILSLMGERQGETAAAAALIQSNRLYYALAGNVRIAVYRRGDLIPVSEGQTLNVYARHCYEEGRISKDLAVSLLNQERIYNLLGQEIFDEVESNRQPVDLAYGDIVVLMTDGVFHALTWRHLESTLQIGGNPKEIAHRIIEDVRQATLSDGDNASVLVYRN